jgi:hypothetical protein
VIAGLALGFLAWCVLVAAQVGAPTDSSRWDAAMLHQKQRLAAERDGPRLLVMAGSSARYGISCAIIEARVGLPCMNLGLQAGLKLRYELDYARRVARPGDILLLAFEYQAYSETGGYDPTLVDYVMARDPRYLRTLSIPALVQFAISVDSKRLVEGLSARIARPFAADEPDTVPWNRYGDELYTDAPRQTDSMRVLVHNGVAAATLMNDDAPTRYAKSNLVETADWCRRHSVELWATFPATVHYAAYDSASAKTAVARIRALYTALGAPVLERPEDLWWSEDHFFDTNYHPNDEARTVRSRALAEGICAQLNSTKTPVPRPRCPAAG